MVDIASKFKEHGCWRGGWHFPKSGFSVHSIIQAPAFFYPFAGPLSSLGGLLGGPTPLNCEEVRDVVIMIRVGRTFQPC